MRKGWIFGRFEKQNKRVFFIYLEQNCITTIEETKISLYE
jgi:hypothetical protein